jgi:putative ABC transport system ATP-binding protein
MNLYEVRAVSYRYGRNGQSVSALVDIDLDVHAGEFVAIAGPSGSGKTTLLNLLGLLHAADRGTIRFDGLDVSSLGERGRTRLRRDRLAFIFQGFNLIPVLTAYENVESALFAHPLPSAERRRRTLEALAGVAIAEQAGQRPNRMSGGQQQRVAIARALVRDVDVVLADEPTAALDQATGRAVMELLRSLNRERGITFIFSTHDPRILAAADRVVHLTDGRVTS